MNLRIALFPLLIAAYAVPAQATSLNLLVNGDFGTPDIGITDFIPLLETPAGFGWVIMNESSNFSVSHIGSFWAGMGGPLNSRGNDQSVQIARSSSIAQSFATTPGTEYELSFYYSHNPFTGPAEQAVSVEGNSILYEAILFHDTPNSGANMMWTLAMATFVADSSLTTLTFAGTPGADFHLFALDDVAVVSTVIPLPASLFLLLSGLTTLSLRWRRSS